MNHDFVGGHELDNPNAGRLFKIVFGLGGLTLMSLFTCVQLFDVQREAMMEERGKRGSYVLNDYMAEQGKQRTEAGESVPEVTNSEPAFRLKHIPLAQARDKVLKNPALLKAGAPPPGWIHPDDLAGGGSSDAAAAPPPGIVPGARPPGIVPGAPPPGIVPGVRPPGIVPGTPPPGVRPAPGATPTPAPTKAAPAKAPAPAKAAPAKAPAPTKAPAPGH
jgi:hypothetical protein